MATIRITPEILREKAAAIRQQKSVHDGAMSSIKGTIDGLQDVFEGAAQRAIVQKYESMTPTFTAFSESLETYAQMLETAATTFETTDTSISGKIG